jgi:hypothetical protein
MTKAGYPALTTKTGLVSNADARETFLGNGQATAGPGDRGCVAAYLLSNPGDTTPANRALHAFIRFQEQVGAQLGAVLGIALVRQVVAYPAYGTPGYKRLMYAVDGEKGRLMVTLKQIEGDPGIEVTGVRRP